jgi:hypothetical protein
MTISHTITRERTVATGPLCIATIDVEDEIDIEVEVNVTPASLGHRDRYGCPEEPDTPAELEIVKVTPDIELEADEIDAIEQKAWGQIAD